MVNDAKATFDAIHHSRLLKFRSPQGAIECQGTVTICLEVSKEGRDAVCILLATFNDVENVEQMHPESIPSGGTLFSFDLKMPEVPGILNYYFILNTGSSLFYVGAPTGSGMSQIYSESPMPYQITVYKPFETPEWFKRSIMYQIFPDRFYREGRGGLDRTAYHAQLGRPVVVHDDWNERPMYLPLDGEPHYRPCDFFGGDLDGIIKKLPYLKKLNVGCLYLNPVFEASSNHRYDTSDYKKIDPVLGTNEEFATLCEEAAKLGIKVIIDGAFSHTGDDSVYFNKYGRYDSLGAYQSQQSKYSGWYQFTNFPNDYKSWWGFKSLPEVNEMDEGYLDFIATGEESVLSFWDDHGLMGWRLDVADELPDAFIKQLRSSLKAKNPQSLLLGEVWEDASTKVSMGARRQYVMGEELDSVMNYPFQSALVDFLLGRSSAPKFCDRLGQMRENYPKPFYYALMNLLSSHDIVRIASVLGGAPHSSDIPREMQADYHFSTEQKNTAKVLLRLAAGIQFSMPGVPCIYYGDEAGMFGMRDPFNRGTYPWGGEDEELLAYYEKLTSIRAESDALKSGFCAFASEREDIFAIARFTHGAKDAFGKAAQDSSCITLVNRSQSPREVELTREFFKEGPDAACVQFSKRYVDCLSGESIDVKDGALSFTMPPVSVFILQGQ